MRRPIAFYPDLAIELGNIESAIYYQQMWYWHDKGNREDGFFYKSKKEFEYETTLSWKQQDRIRKNLIQRGWLEVKLIKVNGAPTLHYAPTMDIQFLIMPKGNNPKSPKVTIHSPETAQSSITENTTETTTSAQSAKDIAEVIDAFKVVNPSYKLYYNRPPQRASAARLLETHGKEKLLQVISILPQSNRMPYVPSVTTPIQLEEKWGLLEAALHKKKAEFVKQDIKNNVIFS